MYGISHDGLPFEVFARREAVDEPRMVIRFECKEGMGVLGIRKVGRADPAPSTVYQEADIDPESLRAGRFVHVLNTGQRQSYALSRLTMETAARLPVDAWVELQPQTEYGFRYLVAPEDKLGAPAAPVAAVAVAVAVAASPEALASEPPAAAAVRHVAIDAPRLVATSSVPEPVPMAPALAQSALAQLDRDSAIRHLTEEMKKVSMLQAQLARLQEELERSSSREKDLITMLSRWRER